MRILVTGALGQLGQELCKHAAARGIDVVATDLRELDILDAAAVNKLFRKAKPDAVFNAAAWTAVDAAEADADEVFRTNKNGAENIAHACATVNIPLVHYSTDYVFDGRKQGAYVEDDTPNPCSVYGRSKLASEHAISELCERHLVFRTSWVFSSHGNNFVKTMLRLARERTELRIVTDQVGKPTSASVLAEYSLVALMRSEVAWGTYHLAQPDPISWYNFALQVFEQARAAGVQLRVKDVLPIVSAEYPTAATRPANSVLDCTKF